jgi:hypothetical protein
MFMKGVDRADQYPADYSLLRKTVKSTKKVALWLINCALFNSFMVYKNLNSGSKFKYKAWATDEIQVTQTQTQTQCDLDHKLTPHTGLTWIPLGDFWVICGNMSSGKVSTWQEEVSC